MKKEKVLSELNRQYDIVCEKIPECRVIGIFLRGSQNYGLANENSDIDSVALIFPSKEEFIMNKEATNYTIEDGKENKIQILDIRLFFSQLRKSSPNCLELLFTEYYINNVDFGYDYHWNILKMKADEIAYLDKDRLLQSYAGFVNTNMKQFENVESKRHKKGYQILRIWELVKGILEGKAYSECLISKSPYTKMIKNKEVPADDLILDMGKVVCLKIDSQPSFEKKDATILDRLQKDMMLFYMKKVF